MKAHIIIHFCKGAWWGRVCIPSFWSIDTLPHPTFAQALIAALNLYQSKVYKEKV